MSDPAHQSAQQPANAADLPSAVHTVLLFVKALVEAIPMVAPPRPAYPSITSPNSGDVLDPGPLTVQVSCNRADLPHEVTLLDPDTLLGLDPPQLVTFAGGNTGTAGITIPTASGLTPPTDYLIECMASGGGNAHRVLVTRRGTIAPPELHVTIGTDKPPPFLVNDPITFEAKVIGGTEPNTFVWIFTAPPGMPTTNPVTHAFDSAGTYNVELFVGDSTSPSPLSKLATFGPFDVVE